MQPDRSVIPDSRSSFGRLVEGGGNELDEVALFAKDEALGLREVEFGDGVGDGGVRGWEENRRAIFDGVGEAEGWKLEDFQEYGAALKGSGECTSDEWREKTHGPWLVNCEP